MGKGDCLLFVGVERTVPAGTRIELALQASEADLFYRRFDVRVWIGAQILGESHRLAQSAAGHIGGVRDEEHALSRREVDLAAAAAPQSGQRLEQKLPVHAMV